MKNHLFC